MTWIQLPGGKFLNLAAVVDAHFYELPDGFVERVQVGDEDRPRYSGSRPAVRLTFLMVTREEFGPATFERHLYDDEAVALRRALATLAGVA